MTRLLETDDLVENIKAAFPTQPLPADEDIPSDSYSVNLYLQGKTWPEITAKDLLSSKFDGAASYLSFLKPRGFCYFLPAYMLMVFHAATPDEQHMYFGLYPGLTPKYAWPHNFIVTENNRQNPDPVFLERFAPLTPKQKQVVADFLYHQSLYNGTELSMDENWNQEPRNAFMAYWYQFASQKSDNN